VAGEATASPLSRALVRITPMGTDGVRSRSASPVAACLQKLRPRLTQKRGSRCLLLSLKPQFTHSDIDLIHLGLAQRTARALVGHGLPAGSGCGAAAPCPLSNTSVSRLTENSGRHQLDGRHNISIMAGDPWIHTTRLVTPMCAPVIIHAQAWALAAR
jgi:hypothetical protein